MCDYCKFTTVKYQPLKFNINQFINDFISFPKIVAFQIAVR